MDEKDNAEDQEITDDLDWLINTFEDRQVWQKEISKIRTCSTHEAQDN